MGFYPALVKQSTTTAGTGDLTLTAASPGYRGFLEGFGAGTGVVVRYGARNGGNYEIGYGPMNMTTQVLTRSNPVETSNGDALVSFTGTTDVYFDALPGDRQTRTVSSNTTLDHASIGNVIRCTQSSDITITLPAVATIPGGANQLSMGYLIRNAGTNNSIVYVDPNGSETIDGVSTAFPLFVGETIELLSLGTSWLAISKPTGWRQFSVQSASASASIDFILPAYSTRARYRFEFSHVRTATDGALLWARTGSGSYDSGASDYRTTAMYVTGAASLAGNEATGSALQCSVDMDTGSAAHTILGDLTLFPGRGGVRYPEFNGSSTARGNGGSFAGWQKYVYGGNRDAAMDIDRLQFLASTGNIGLGDFSAYACFD